MDHHREAPHQASKASLDESHERGETWMVKREIFFSKETESEGKQDEQILQLLSKKLAYAIRKKVSTHRWNLWESIMQDSSEMEGKKQG